MRSYLADFNREYGADAVDLAAAMAGYENGRNRRFLNYTDSDYTFANRGKEKSDDLVDFILTQNIDYEALFESTMGKVRGAEDAVEKVLNMAAAKVAESQAKLDEMIDRLPTLEDGTKVTKDKHGNVVTLDGKAVDPEDAASVQFKGHEDSLENINKQKEQVNANMDVLNTARRDEVRLGEIREEFDTKPDAKRVEGIKERNLKIIEAQSNPNYENENRITDVDFSNSAPLSL